MPLRRRTRASSAPDGHSMGGVLSLAGRAARAHSRELRGVRRRCAADARHRLRADRTDARVPAADRTGGAARLLALGGDVARIAGSYRKHETVDVVYDVGGRRRVETGLVPAGIGRLGGCSAEPCDAHELVYRAPEDVSGPRAYAGRKSTAPFTSETTKPSPSGSRSMRRGRRGSRRPPRVRASVRVAAARRLDVAAECDVRAPFAGAATRRAPPTT